MRCYSRAPILGDLGAMVGICLTYMNKVRPNTHLSVMYLHFEGGGGKGRRPSYLQVGN